MKYFKENQPELDINQNLINSISICALLHNVGHTCYTNSFSSFLKDKYNYDFNRFEMAEKIFDDILNKENIDSKTNNENEQFDEKICKKILLRKEKSSHFYEEIVNNTKNGIDANIFDYLKRDIYKYGFPKQSFEYQILMNNAFVINDDEMDEKPTINIPKVFPYGEKDNDTYFIRPIYNQKQFQKFKAEENLKKEIEYNKQNKVINPNLIESSQSSYMINNRIVHNLPKNIKVPENKDFVIDEPIKNNEPVVPKVVQVQSGFMTSDFL